MASAPARPTARHLIETATVGAYTFCWYALPDVVRSRPWRITARVGLTAAVVGGLTTLFVRTSPDSSTDIPDTIAAAIAPPHTDAAEDLATKLRSPAPVTIALAAVLGSGLAALSVWGEKAIYRRGERRRSLGVARAHTRQAAGLAVFAAIAQLGMALGEENLAQ